MMNWKISKLRILAFKAFTDISFDLASNALITLEGPNGYGKTTVFDAIELLFTGQIYRVGELFRNVMPKGKINYRDNLYWNLKNGEKDIFIRVELVEATSGERRWFARVADINDLRTKSNNRADKFGIFKLFQLNGFDDESYGQALDEDYLDSLLGVNFARNYQRLNYLHQGESSFIFNSTTAARKSALEGLIDAKTTNDKIDLLAKVEKRLTTRINSPVERDRRQELEKQISALANVLPNADAIEFIKISSREPRPDWDAENPFAVLDSALFMKILDDLLVLKQSSQLIPEIKIRIQNRAVEKYIAEKDELLTLAVKVGHHKDRYPQLKEQNKNLSDFTQIISRLKKDVKILNIDDIEFVIAKGIYLDNMIFENIRLRDGLLTQVDSKGIAFSAIESSRKDLLENFNKIKKEHDACCPLCGHDWSTEEMLVAAFDATATGLQTEIGELGKRLTNSLATITDSLAPKLSEIVSSQENLEKQFDRALFLELEKHQESFDNLDKLNERLTSQGISYDLVFTSDSVILDQRKTELIEKIRSLKKPEGEIPPEGWEIAISSGFQKIEDFYAIDIKLFDQKDRYIRYVYQNRQSAVLASARKELQDLKNRLRATQIAKEKVSNLKAILTRTEKAYSDRTIADIELIFHIYSGRLIQNYQRGLGLFIDRDDGTKLQFCTADRSEHDATLSMSSGQISALSLAFFLSLNRVYSKCPLVLIDDPAQSLDDINIASLTDLLRCELKDRQLIMSSHEDDIASYMRYRFKRAGLSQKAFHMQTHLEALN